MQAELEQERAVAARLQADLTAAHKAAAAAAQEAAVARTCSVCFEAYDQTQVVPRLLIKCGHTFCELCLDQMLRPLLFKNGGKRVECPVCKFDNRVQKGRAAQLPKNFDIL